MNILLVAAECRIPQGGLNNTIQEQKQKVKPKARYATNEGATPAPSHDQETPCTDSK
jgi:hypothetical protein